MPRKSDNDLFRESTMTFGEHLEELRTCLFRALLGLIVGFLIGLIFASRVVNFIQVPLEDALKEHYIGSAVERVEQDLERLEDEGLPLPGTPEQLAELVTTQNLLPEPVFVQPSELHQQLESLYSRVRTERSESLRVLASADRLVERLRSPNEDSGEELEEDELARLVEALQSLGPIKLPAASPSLEVTEDDLDRIRDQLQGGEALNRDDLALLAAAIDVQQKRLQDEVAWASEGVDLLDRTRLAGKRPRERLQRDDLVQVFIWRPIENDTRIHPIALNAHEAFAIFIKGALLVGVLLASPWIFFQIWSFVAAGLYFHERRFVYVFLPFSLGLFFAGASLAFFFVFKPVLKFLFYFNDALNIDPNPRITEWLSFVLILPLGFGIAFQLPLVMLFLERIGVFTIQAYLSRWRIAILVIFVLAMFLTPADPQSMLLMAVPLTALYFGGVLLCYLMPRRRSPYDEMED